MKQFLWLIFLLTVCVLLSGCTILNGWIIKGDIKDVKGNYGLNAGEAGRGDAIFGRYLLITDQKVNKGFIESLPIIKVSVSDDNKVKSVFMGRDEIKP